MLKIDTIINDNPELQKYEWPPVDKFHDFEDSFSNFLNLKLLEKQVFVKSLNTEEKIKFVHKNLGLIYAYEYGYIDSPCYLKSNIELETKLFGAKLALENEFHANILQVANIDISSINSQEDAYEYLKEFTKFNKGVKHELFDYIRDNIKKEAMLDFLRLEIFRNEVVDDEVALMVCGLQGNMKKVSSSNLWDECGNGKLNNFHTYWLRRLINKLGEWNTIIDYRETKKPWFSTITSNTFNSLATRSCYKFRAYGCFLTTESWVEPHFEDILFALNRLNLNDSDITVYFDAHKTVDPQHTDEMLTAILSQTPRLTSLEAKELVIGSNIAVRGALEQYKRVLELLKNIDKSIGDK